MSIVKAYDVGYVRFRAPDLARMKEFLLDFGMYEAGQTPARLLMRGYGASPFIHVTELGEPGFAGFAIELNSVADLHALAAAEGKAVAPLDMLGGGQVLRLIDPDGFVVEAVAGQDRVAALDLPSHLPWNQGGMYPRLARPRRVPPGPAHCKRLGHVVLGVTDFRRSEAWYKDRFGFVTSDEIQPAPGHAIGAFMRCDRGGEPCDHHTLFLLQRPGPPGFMHAAFEVCDLDDLMAGHAHLEAVAAKQVWGVGRHLLGSQVFDYWQDPWGHEVEHWTDGDQLVTKDGGGIAGIDQLIGVQWGMKMPPLPEGAM